MQKRLYYQIIMYRYQLIYFNYIITLMHGALVVI